jgi:S-adenosyl-L-methionine hydrolase (adenosine-forming)
MAIVTLTTDFGTKDGYVGAMKGVIATLAPGAQLVDITHDVPPQDVAAASFALGQAARHFPDGTVHLCVVDPGVGGARRPIAAFDGRHYFVGPDNGVFSPFALAPDAVHEIAFDPDAASATFHGRDVFAPAAARLAAGAELRALGPARRMATTKGPAAPRVTRAGQRVEGHVVHVDRFGNLITNVPAALLPGGARVRVGKLSVRGVSRTYEDVPRSRPLAYVGSAGLLELAVREGSAAETYGVGCGARVTIERATKRRAR